MRNGTTHLAKTRGSYFIPPGIWRTNSANCRHFKGGIAYPPAHLANLKATTSPKPGGVILYPPSSGDSPFRLPVRGDGPSLTESSALIEADLSTGEIDLLFQVPWLPMDPGDPKRLATTPAQVAIIFEHQSSVDPTMAFRMLRYTVRTWERWLREPANRRTGRLPLVLPVVLYHGSRPWSAATNIAALVGPTPAPPEISALLSTLAPRATYQLLDLRETEESELWGTWPGLLCLWLFKAHASGDLISVLARFFEAHGPLGSPETGDPETLAAFVDYMWSTDSRLKGLPDHAKVLEILQESIG